MRDTKCQLVWVLLFTAISIVSCSYLENQTPPAKTPPLSKAENTVTASSQSSIPLPFGLIVIQLCKGQNSPCPNKILFANANGESKQYQFTGYDLNLAHNFQKGAYIDGGDIWLIDFSNEKNENLTHTHDCKERNVTWSPDDTSLAFLGCSGDPSINEIYLLDLASGKRTNLSNTPNRYESCFYTNSAPSSHCSFGWWSQHPSFIFAGSGIPKQSVPGEVMQGLCHTYNGECNTFPTKISVDGKDYKILDPLNGLENQPALSPDGKILAYDGGILYSLETNKQETIYPSDFGLHVEGSNTSGDPQLISPNWSPDGKQIAWIGHVNGNGDNGLFVFDISRHEGQILYAYTPYYATYMLPAWKRWSNAGITWSPDSQWITLSDTESYNNGAFLYAFSRDGKTKVKFGKGDIDIGSPIWSPDSTRLAFIKSYYGISGIPQTIQIVEINDMKVSQLDISGNFFPIAWFQP